MVRTISTNDSTATQVAESISSPDETRDELLAKARAFLRSPAVISQDAATQRQFLEGKGLHSEEIVRLISENPPPIPPRTYPRPAPSKLPVILYATLKLLFMLTGASVVSAAMYFTYIYPKLAASFGARAQLIGHQIGLLKQLHAGSTTTRQLQREAGLLPRQIEQPDSDIPNLTVEDTTVEFESIQQIEGAALEENAEEGAESQDRALPSDQERLFSALKDLKEAIPRRKPAYTSTLQDISDMTAFITSRMYSPKVHSPLEGEVRKELRAAKGLLLNRKTFASTRPPPLSPA